MRHLPVFAPPRRMAGAPVVIGSDGGSAALEKLNLGSASYSEAWLQDLVLRHPEVMPVADIEPGFGAVLPVAGEVPCGHGQIDALFVTPDGSIVLVEAKLWRNPQARREVVAQALDYVAALTGMDYEAFEAACRKGRGMAAATLYDVVADHPDALPEAGFIDAVSRNLARGRLLLIALGDGIRSEAQALASLLQGHAGAHFTFALVELAIWRHPGTGDLIALPGTLACTEMITRGVVSIENGQAMVRAVPDTLPSRPGSISQELFYEELARIDPHLPGNLQAFIAGLEPLGVYIDLKGALNLKFDPPGGGKTVNLGYIRRNGKVWTDAASWSLPRDVAQRYNGALAALIGGTVACFPSGNAYVSNDSGTAPSLTALLPLHAPAWTAAIADVAHSLRSTAVPDGDDVSVRYIP